MSKKIEVSEETWSKIKDTVLEDLVGSNLFFRTVTYHYVGKVVKVTGRFIELSTASWVADSGRFMNAIKDGTLDEVEPIGKMWLNVDSLIDMIPWEHKLPTKQE